MELIPHVDPEKSHIVNGKTLNALISLANQWANLEVVDVDGEGAKSELIRGEARTILRIARTALPGSSGGSGSTGGSGAPVYALKTVALCDPAETVTFVVLA